MSNTSELDLESLKYPIGRFARGTRAATPERQALCIEVLESFPVRLRNAVRDLSEVQLGTPYRPGGWTVRQLVHHLADSHGQSLHRFKLALTEEMPVIKAYKEALWAEQADARVLPVEPSLQIISGTHERWVFLLGSLDQRAYQRGFFHPEQKREITLAEALELYVWHSTHHLAHINNLRERMGW